MRGDGAKRSMRTTQKKKEKKGRQIPSTKRVTERGVGVQIAEAIVEGAEKLKISAVRPARRPNAPFRTVKAPFCEENAPFCTCKAPFRALKQPQFRTPES
eukprot:124711-Rhodomonas_salina.1